MEKPDWKLWLNDDQKCKKWLNHYKKIKIIRKSSNDSGLHLMKALHNLKFANWIIQKHDDEIKEYFRDESFYDWAICIYYYAIYHAATALVSKEGFSSKNHSAVLCFLIFNHYHKRKLLKKEDVNLIAKSLDKQEIEILGHSKELRERASYDVHILFEKDLARQAMNNAVDFVNKIKSLLE